MPMNSGGGVRRSSAGQLWFLFAALSLGIVIGTAMPTLPLIGLRSVAPKVGELASAYVGGIGIGLIVGGGGLLLGMIMRAVLMMATSRRDSRNRKAEWVTSAVCLVVGALFWAWYFCSYRFA